MLWCTLMHKPACNRHSLGRSVYGRLCDVCKCGMQFEVDACRRIGATAVLLTPVVMTAEGDGPMGQAPMSFFAPNPALAVGQSPLAAVQELKHVIKQLHAHGIKVILQVIIHTTYVFCMRGSLQQVVRHVVHTACAAERLMRSLWAFSRSAKGVSVPERRWEGDGRGRHIIDGQLGQGGGADKPCNGQGGTVGRG